MKQSLTGLAASLGRAARRFEDRLRESKALMGMQSDGLGDVAQALCLGWVLDWAINLSEVSTPLHSRQARQEAWQGIVTEVMTHGVGEAGQDINRSQMAWDADRFLATYQEACAEWQELLPSSIHAAGPGAGFGDAALLEFVEEFFAAVDPDQRNRKGVFYTPAPIVQFMTSSIQEILQQDFSCAKGLADPQVVLVDFATGTGTFLESCVSIMRDVENDLTELQRHLRERVFGLEIMPPAALVARRLLLRQTTRAGLEDGPQVRVMNALLPWDFLGTPKPDDLCVILGNPPYRGQSENQMLDPGIGAYRRRGTEKLGERNPKWLQDDYVKFLRRAQVQCQGYQRALIGVVANHSWLDNPTFRLMRRSLLDDFSCMYVLDLHGNSRKRERTVDGRADQSLFGIMQGSCIAFLIRDTDPVRGQATGQARGVFHADLFGRREPKAHALSDGSWQTWPWKRIQPREPSWIFRQGLGRGSPYFSVGLDQVFVRFGCGVTTHRDRACFTFTKKELENRLDDLCDPSIPDHVVRKQYGFADGGEWRLAYARARLQRDGINQDHIRPCLYRPWDHRWCYWGSELMDRPRLRLMSQMLVANPSLATIRKLDTHGAWNHVLATDGLMAHHAVSMKEVNYLFPLWSWPGGLGGADRIPNFRAEFRDCLRDCYQEEPAPETLYFYLLAVLHSDPWREAEAEAFRFGWPRIPLVRDLQAFTSLAALGSKLYAAQVPPGGGKTTSPSMRPDVDASGLTQVPISWMNYDAASRYVSIAKPSETSGKKQKLGFGPISEAVMDYEVGGYPVLKRYLMDRRGRYLTEAEVGHLIETVASLEAMIALRQELAALWTDCELVRA